jgi:2'-5' RNA ligase
MEGIISLLDTETDHVVREIWDVLESRFGCVIASQVEAPHLSWHVAESYQTEPLKSGFVHLVDKQKPFSLYTCGFGVFINPVPVLYLAVSANARMISLHQKITRLANKLSTNPNSYYAPLVWAPHITLAHQDVDPGSLGEMVTLIAQYPIQRTIRMDNIAVLCETEDGESGICRMDFNG